MSLTERINLLNKSNSDSSNKENIEDFALSRSTDIFDGSLLDQSSRRNSSIRKLKHQFEQQQQQQEQQNRVNSQRISMTRQYSHEKKLVKTQIEAMAKQKEISTVASASVASVSVVVLAKPQPTTIESPKISEVKPTAAAEEIPANLHRFFVGASSQERRLEERKDCDKKRNNEKQVQSTVTRTTCDFEDIFKDARKASDRGWEKDTSSGSAFSQIYLRLRAADLSDVDEKFERLFKLISQDNLGMIFEFLHFHPCSVELSPRLILYSLNSPL